MECFLWNFTLIKMTMTSCMQQKKCAVVVNNKAAAYQKKGFVVFLPLEIAIIWRQWGTGAI